MEKYDLHSDLNDMMSVPSWYRFALVVLSSYERYKC